MKCGRINKLSVYGVRKPTGQSKYPVGGGEELEDYRRGDQNPDIEDLLLIQIINILS